jgi:hypothetical protein
MRYKHALTLLKCTYVPTTDGAEKWIVRNPLAIDCLGYPPFIKEVEFRTTLWNDAHPDKQDTRMLSLFYLYVVVTDLYIRTMLELGLVYDGDAWCATIAHFARMVESQNRQVFDDIIGPFVSDVPHGIPF